MKTISVPCNPDEVVFSRKQKSVYKNIERTLGVLSARFKILQRLFLFWFCEDTAHVMKTCIILHNMFVDVVLCMFGNKYGIVAKRQESGAVETEDHVTTQFEWLVKAK